MNKELWQIAVKSLFCGSLFVLAFGMYLHATVAVSAADASDPIALSQVDPKVWRWGVCKIFSLVEGDYGALMMVLAGMVTIIAASAGQYRLAYSLVVVGVGSFIMRAIISLWFGGFDCPGADDAYDPITNSNSTPVSQPPEFDL